MITIRADLFGVEETITRPILVIVTEDIKKILGLSKDIYTQYDNKDQIVKKKNRLGEIQGDNTAKDEMIFIEYEEDSEDTKETSLIPMRPDFFPYYKDDDVDASVMPIQHRRQLVIKFKFVTKSKSKAYALTNKVRLLTSNEGYYRRHRLEYLVSLPNFIEQLLTHIYNLKYNRIEDKIPFEEYLENTMDIRADFTNTLDGDGKKSRIGIRDLQTEVPGYVLDDLYNLKPEYEEDTAYWGFEFNYGLIYEKPVTLLVKYPVLIYNQLIDPFFRSFIEDGWREKNNINPPMTARSRDAIELFEEDRIFMPKNNNYYLTLPDFDNEQLPRVEYYISRMFSVMSIIDENDPTLLFNIQDIPKIKFKDSVLKFIINQDRKYVTEKLKSMFYIELYKNDKRDFGNKLILSEDGTLRSSKPLEYEYIYRVMFNVINDLTMLDKDAKLRIKQFILDQVEEDKETNRKPSFNQATTYDLNYYNSRKFNYALEKDNLVTWYLSLINIKDDVIANVLNSVDNFYDIPFKITDTTGRYNMRTVATSDILALRSIMDLK